MKAIQIYLDTKEYKRLKKDKGSYTWKEVLMYGCTCLHKLKRHHRKDDDKYFEGLQWK